MKNEFKLYCKIVSVNYRTGNYTTKISVFKFFESTIEIIIFNRSNSDILTKFYLDDEELK